MPLDKTLIERTFLPKMHRAFDNFLTLSEQQLQSLYQPDACFIDPLGKVEGMAAITAYFQRGAAGLDRCDFIFGRVLIDGAVLNQSWVMHYQHPKLNGGRSLYLDGTSVIELGDDLRIIEHRDYFDVGHMLYRHIPVLGFVIKALDKRLVS